jgi:hypothetical protein
MSVSLIVKGKFINQYTIRLDEPATMTEGELRVLIEKPQKGEVNKNINWSKIVPREITPFKPLSRDEIYER